MKVSREQAARNHERIVETASQLFRERGFEGIGVADLMKEAGLTHGGFYGHFSSKEDLIAEASACALMHSLTHFSNASAALAPTGSRDLKRLSIHGLGSRAYSAGFKVSTLLHSKVSGFIQPIERMKGADSQFGIFGVNQHREFDLGCGDGANIDAFF